MPRKKVDPEISLEENTRQVKGLSNEAGGAIALSTNGNSFLNKEQGLNARAIALEESVAKATKMMMALVGASNKQIDKIEEDVLSLATGGSSVADLVEKYGLTTNAEKSQQFATLEKVCNSIAVKAKVVGAELEGIKLEGLKVDKVAATFRVVGKAAQMIDAADGAAFELAKTEGNHEGRQDELDHRSDRRQTAREYYTLDGQYRREWNKKEGENKTNILTSKQQLNGILAEARAITAATLQAKNDKRKYNLRSVQDANNGEVGKS